MSDPDYNDYEHLPDPVPVLVSGNGIKPTEPGLKTWNEMICEKGFRLSGNGLLPFVLKHVNQNKPAFLHRE
jgi:hypothetical protein